MNKYSVGLALLLLGGWLNAATITVDTNDDDGIANDGDCSLREAVLASQLNIPLDTCSAGSAGSQDIIQFDASLFPPPLGIAIIGLMSPIDISDPDLAINGPVSGSLTIAGNGTERIFDVNHSNNGVLLIQRVLLFGGNTTGDGGAILLRGDTALLTLNDVSFSSNQADGYGGGIGFEGDFDRELQLSGISASGNQSVLGGGVIGGVLAGNNVIVIDDSEFSSNSTGESGGAIYLSLRNTADNDRVTATVSNSRFFNNIAAVAGGGIAVTSGSNTANRFTLNVDTSAFEENQAMGTVGGGLVASGNLAGTESLRIKRSTFVQNFSGGSGAGASANSVRVVEVENNLFALNEGQTFVGALTVSSSSNTVASDMHVIGNSFYRNVAGANTGSSASYDLRMAAPNVASTMVSYVGNLFDTDVLTGDKPCTLTISPGLPTVIEGYNVVRNTTSASTCVTSADDMIVSETGSEYVDTSVGVHSKNLRLSSASPAVDFWPETECLDATGVDLVFDLLGNRRNGGVPADGDAAGAAECDSGADEAPTGYLLSVSKNGGGSGSVTSDPVGIDCGSDCVAPFFAFSTTNLTATADPGSVFDGWAGACSGTGNCMVNMGNFAKAVTATFETGQSHSVSIQIAGTGTGSVTSVPSGINCPGSCNADFAQGTDVTLTASPGLNSVFDSWGDDCSGAGGSVCVLNVDADQLATANFDASAYPLDVNVIGTGSGNVQSTPGGISCPSDCSEDFATGTMVELVATPLAGAVFAGWTGACLGSGACMVTMDQARLVRAEFQILQTLNVSTLGTGTGVVVSSPVGIDCDPDCSADFDTGTVVSLSVMPSLDSVFIEWGGDCSGFGACQVVMNGTRNVTAEFALDTALLSVGVTGAGTGVVASSPVGIACPGDCSEVYSVGTMVTLVPDPIIGSTFVGWTGACSGSGSCIVNMDMDRSVSAQFGLAGFDLTVLLQGDGTVTSNPGGINCPGDCSEFYLEGQVVDLTATPGPGQQFQHWAGDCQGASCQVTLDQPRTVFAVFAGSDVIYLDSLE